MQPPHQSAARHFSREGGASSARDGEVAPTAFPTAYRPTPPTARGKVGIPLLPVLCAHHASSATRGPAFISTLVRIALLASDSAQSWSAIRRGGGKSVSPPKKNHQPGQMATDPHILVRGRIDLRGGAAIGRARTSGAERVPLQRGSTCVPYTLGDNYKLTSLGFQEVPRLASANDYSSGAVLSPSIVPTVVTCL